MAGVRTTVAIWMIVVKAVMIERMPVFTWTWIATIVRAFTEEGIVPTVPDPAWAVNGGESP